MSRLIRHLVLCLLFLVPVAGIAQASPLINPGLTKINYSNWESVWNADGTTVMKPGSIVYGIIRTTWMETSYDGKLVSEWNYSSNDMLSGAFIMQVTSVAPGQYLPIYTLAPVTSIPSNFTYASLYSSVFSQSDLAQNTVLKLFWDTQTNITSAGVTTTAKSIEAAVDGAPWMSMSMSGGDDYYVMKQTGASEYNGYYNLSINLQNGQDIDWLPLLNASSLLGGYADYIGKASVYKGEPVGLDKLWQYASSDPAYFNAAAPEPASMLLMGVGLCGMGVSVWRKRRHG